MPDLAKASLNSIEDAFRAAMVRAWDDFSALTAPRAIRVEYLNERGSALDQLTVWLVSTGGYQDRICDYRAGSAAHEPRVWQCWTRLRSAKLVGALNFIMRNQERFTRAADASHCGVIVVFPPTDEQRAEAATWAAGIGLTVTVPAELRARAASSMRAG